MTIFRTTTASARAARGRNAVAARASTRSLSSALAPALILALTLGVTLALGGCSLFHSSTADGKPKRCSEPAIANTPVNRPPLKVPDGLDPPNTGSAVVIPPLNEPDTPRAATDPCLTSPPDYGTPDSGKR